MFIRSSQSSMVSTNPFESDDDDEDINISSGLRSVNGGSTTTITSRTPRKKRRAPAPPTPVSSIHNYLFTCLKEISYVIFLICLPF